MQTLYYTKRSHAVIYTFPIFSDAFYAVVSDLSREKRIFTSSADIARNMSRSGSKVPSMARFVHEPTLLKDGRVHGASRRTG